jgi:hypothetical protein
MAKRMDLSIVQDVFHDIGGKRNAASSHRFTNFGNLLNHNWGVSQRLVVQAQAEKGASSLRQGSTRKGGPHISSPSRIRAIVTNVQPNRSVQRYARQRHCISSCSVSLLLQLGV